MYAYALNNPTTLNDPLGLKSESGGADCMAQWGGGDNGKMIRGEWTIGERSNCLADGDGFVFVYSFHAPSLPGFDPSYQYRISNEMLVAAEQNLTPTLVLEGRVFVSTLVQNFLDEFKKGGCVALFNKTAFGEPLHQVWDVIKEGPEVMQNGGEGVVGGGLILTKLGAWSEGATTLTSTGITLQSAAQAAEEAGPEFAAGAVNLSEVLALRKELNAMKNGNCY